MNEMENWEFGIWEVDFVIVTVSVSGSQRDGPVYDENILLGWAYWAFLLYILDYHKLFFFFLRISFYLVVGGFFLYLFLMNKDIC